MIDTDGHQILFKVASNGTFISALTSPPDLPAGRPPDFIAQTPWNPKINFAGAFQCTYTVIQGNRQIREPIGGVRGRRHSRPAVTSGRSNEDPKGMALTTVFGTLPGINAPKPK